MKTRRKKTNPVDIERVIEQRLNMQTNKRLLENKYGITPNLSFIKSQGFLNKFNSLDDNKKIEVIQTLGGPINYTKTERFLSNIFS